MLQLGNLKINHVKPVSTIIGAGNVVAVLGVQDDTFTFLKVLAGISTKYEGAICVGNINIKGNEEVYKSYVQSVLWPNSFFKSATIFNQLNAWSTFFNNGANMAVPTLWGLNLLEQSILRPSKASPAMLRMLELSRLMMCEAKIWVVHNLDLYYCEELMEIIQKLIAVKAQSNGIIIFSCINNKSKILDLATSEIKLEDGIE